MKCVVPLAGGDLLHAERGFRALFPVNGEPLLQCALNRRAWRQGLAPSDFVFVLREVPGLDGLVTWLQTMWPGCGIVRIPWMTGGAMLTALAGISVLSDDGEPIIVDLADILFSSGETHPTSWFAPRVGAVVPCFIDDAECYSYLRLENGKVVEAAEKRVISDRASAGVYLFRNRSIYVEAAAYSLNNAASQTYKDIHFVCPMVNGVLKFGWEVAAPLIEHVDPVGKLFH